MIRMSLIALAATVALMPCTSVHSKPLPKHPNSQNAQPLPNDSESNPIAPGDKILPQQKGASEDEPDPQLQNTISYRIHGFSPEFIT